MYVAFNMGIIYYGVVTVCDPGNLLVPPPYISHMYTIYLLTLILVLFVLRFYEFCFITIYEHNSESPLRRYAVTLMRLTSASVLSFVQLWS